MEKSYVKEEKQRNSEERRSCCVINDLPDPLLCHILSFLSTKDSVRSSLLSKRWRSLWLQVPVFDLDSLHFDDDGVDLMEFVDRFLESNKNLDLYRFKMIYNNSFYADSVLKSWIKALVRRRVRHIDFQVKSIYDILVRMPLCLYSSNTLVNLSLYNVALKPVSVVSLPCLKVMRLDRVMYDGSNLETLITSCPVLEKLSIIRGELLELRRVRSESLKSFTFEIWGYKDGLFRYAPDHAVEIYAPSLEHMSLCDDLSRSIVIHSIAPYAVVNIDVHFDVRYGNTLDHDNDSSKRVMIRNFLTGISTVSGMKISSDTLEVIHAYSKLEVLPQFSNLSWLHASFLESFWVPSFLDCCPYLHTLVLEFEFNIEAWPIELSYVPLCFVSSLEYVQLWTPVTTRTSSQMKLANYFLRSCHVLKKLTLSESFLDMIKEIKKVPRKSRKCTIVVG